MAYKSIVYMAELLGTDSNGVRKLARALKVKRYKNGTIEMYDEDAILSGMEKDAEKLSKRSLSKEQQKKMLDGKKAKKN